MRENKIILPTLILVAAVGVHWGLVKTKPTAKKKTVHERQLLVETMPLKKSTEQIVLQTTGTVIPAQEVMLQARVSGEITAISEVFVPGGVFAKGDQLVQLDPVDYQLAVTNRAADLASARFDYKKELGWQSVALREWDLVEDKASASALEKELTLRQPNLEQAQMNLASAEASLAQARLNLARTQIRAPFNGVVDQRMVNVGTQVSGQTQLARLIGTDEFWVRATVPVDQLQWIEVPGAQVRVRQSNGGERGWQGTVIRVEPSLEEKGRLAQILISIPDPMGESPLLLDSYVHVLIEGKKIADIFSVPREALHDGNQLWLKNGEGRLQFREITPMWTDRKRVLFQSGVEEGEVLVLTDLSSPLPGRKLAVAGEMALKQGQPGAQK